MASTRRKSAAIAIAIIGVAGLSLAAAATLNINSNSLAAGSTLVAACDTDSIAVDYTVLGANVTDVLLSGVNGNCAGDDFSIQLEKTVGGVQVALGTPVSGSGVTGLQLTPLTGDARTAAIALGAGNTQPIALVTGISIIIH